MHRESITAGFKHELGSGDLLFMLLVQITLNIISIRTRILRNKLFSRIRENFFHVLHFRVSLTNKNDQAKVTLNVV